MENSVVNDYTKEQLEQYAHGDYEIGNRIRAYDFQPRGERDNLYAEGTIIDLVRINGFIAWKVSVDNDPSYESCGESPRDEIYVPLQVLFGEWDGRVSLVEPEDPSVQGMEQTVYEIVKSLVEPFDGFSSTEITEHISSETDLSLNQVSGYLGQLVQKGIIKPYEMPVNGRTFKSFQLT